MGLTADRFLNLVHYAMIQHTDPKHHDEIGRLVDGPLAAQPGAGRAGRGEADPETGLVPPPWWSGDEQAARSSMTARAQAPPR